MNETSRRFRFKWKEEGVKFDKKSPVWKELEKCSEISVDEDIFILTPHPDRVEECDSSLSFFEQSGLIERID